MSAQSQIIIANDGAGFHNSNPDTLARLDRSMAYKDLSTICVVPTRGVIPARVVQAWMGLMAPMNQQFTRLFVIGLEVGEAYNQAVAAILNNPGLTKFKYMLTLEEDNIPPPDGLIKLYEGMERFDAVGALYWTKGEGGMPMIYGNPAETPKDFRPQRPVQNILQECNGLGMGFTLFRVEMFKKLSPPWFRTLQTYEPGTGAKAYTQDLYFFENAGRAGFRFACDTRVQVGHYDATEDKIW